MDVGVIGLGLIGGSIAMDFSPDFAVMGYDVDAEACSFAKQKKVIECVADSLEDFRACKLIFVATPPNTILPILKQLSTIVRSDVVVTDTAGTKLSIVQRVDRELPQFSRRFVGGHPMAGKERGRIVEAKKGLFEMASWVLTPTMATELPAIEMVAGTVATFGARPVVMTPQEHDETIALLSHVPHVLAGALVEMADPMPHKSVGAGSWQDLTRVAGADPELWTQIVIENRKPIAAHLAQLSNRLDHLRVIIESGDQERLAHFFQQAAETKKRAKHR